MSTEHNEVGDLSLPGIPPGHPANAAIDSMRDLVGAPPIDWESGPPADTPAAGQVADAVATASTAEAAAPAPKARRTRTAKPKDRVPEAADRADAVAKPPRKRSKAASKAATAQDQVQPAAGSAPAIGGGDVPPIGQVQPATGSAPAIGSDDIPPITQEAISFLSNPDAKASDLFKLQPESQAFVQYHITSMQRHEAEAALSYSYLMSMAPKYSPEFEKVADALMAKIAKDRRAGIKPALKPVKPAAAKVAGMSYRQRQTQVGAYRAAPVQLRKMEISAGKSEAEREGSAADMARADRIIGTAHAMLTAPIGDITREQAADLVASDLDDIRAIKDERARQLALNAMIESGHAQPHYQNAFARLAPDLVAPAKEASAAIEAEQAVWDKASPPASKAGEQVAENTIERGTQPELENQPGKDQEKAAPSVDPAAPGVAQSAPAPGIAKRMLRAMGVWLQGKAEQEPAAAPGAKPVSLEKSAAPAAPADDKANLVPEAVARRFLKVEQDYYFPDKSPAFSDRGTKLATRGAHPEVVRSLVEIAQARGWDSITVKGTDEFRRSAWMEASQAGLKVAGYKPTALDLAELASKPASNTVEKGAAKEREAAPAQQSAAQPARAAAAAQGAASKEAAGPAPSPELAAKAQAFEKEKPGFVMKKFPELAQAYGVVDAAKKFAEASLPQDVRDEFVSLARRHVMQKILAGEQVKGPQIYTAPAKSKDAAEQTQAPAQEAVDLGKAPRAKEVARER